MCWLNMTCYGGPAKLKSSRVVTFLNVSICLAATSTHNEYL